MRRALEKVRLSSAADESGMLGKEDRMRLLNSSPESTRLTWMGRVRFMVAESSGHPFLAGASRACGFRVQEWTTVNTLMVSVEQVYSWRLPIDYVI